MSEADIHVTHRFTFATSADRIAGTGYTITSADRLKRAWDEETEAFYVLLDDSPLTWKAESDPSSVTTAQLTTQFEKSFLASRIEKTSAYTLVAGDQGAEVAAISGTWTLSLTAAATLGNGFAFSVFNYGAGVITIDGDGTEAIRDQASSATTKTLAQGEGMFLVSNGVDSFSGYKFRNLSNVTNDAQLKASDLDTDGTMAANSASKIPAQSAVRTYIAAALAALVASSPSTLDTLNELAAALGNDPSFATTVATSLGLKAPLASPALTGTPTAPTAAPGTNTTQLATVAFVQAAIAAIGGGGGTLDSLTANGADLASAGTLDLDTDTSDVRNITGTTTITAVTLAAGHQRTIRFAGILILTNGASLILPGGANITTAAGDYAQLRGYASGVVRCFAYTRADGTALFASSAGIGSVGSTAISSTSIDWSLGNVHYKTLAANTTFTFANASDGQTIRVFLTQTAAYTATFPTVAWTDGAQPIQTTLNATDIWVFTKVGGTIYGSIEPRKYVVTGYRYLRFYASNVPGSYLQIYNLRFKVGSTEYPVNMTSYTLPTPNVVSVDSEFAGTYYGWQGVDSSISGGTSWHTGPGAPHWFKLDLGASNGIIPNGFVIRINGVGSTRYPQDFQIQGSNTGAFAGEESVLYSATGLSTGWTDNVDRTFSW